MSAPTMVHTRRGIIAVTPSRTGSTYSLVVVFAGCQHTRGSAETFRSIMAAKNAGEMMLDQACTRCDDIKVIAAMDRTGGELDAAVIAYREHPTDENRARLDAAMAEHHERFLSDQTIEFQGRTH